MGAHRKFRLRMENMTVLGVPHTKITILDSKGEVIHTETKPGELTMAGVQKIMNEFNQKSEVING